MIVEHVFIYFHFLRGSETVSLVIFVKGLPPTHRQLETMSHYRLVDKISILHSDQEDMSLDYLSQTIQKPDYQATWGAERD